MLVFQYGSNLSSRRLNSRQRLGGAARVVGIARTRHPYQFCFPVWGGINDCAAAGILPGGERPVWGVVYDIPHHFVVRSETADHPTLDAIEDEGRDYWRGPVELLSADGKDFPENIQTYHPRQPRQDLVTQWHYVRHILEGAREHALPPDYQNHLVACMLDNNPNLKTQLNETATL
ncbi:gamma-glutamylcyclotransferase family protein [Natronospira sp.]|uniref:gamma-glutamylcyclotransferase family protein n=1 Tax=Natronospira sp. TaxID=2024970 RepID=UPI003872DA2D